MIKHVAYATLLGIALTCSTAFSGAPTGTKNCPSHTTEQKVLIFTAYAKGYQHDLGLTLAAITWQESFVGQYVVRINPKDSKHGSYGISHISLEYAMEQEGIVSQWKAKDELVMRLMTDDQYALDLSIRKLLEYKDRGWKKMVQKYNGRGKAAEKYQMSVSDKVHKLKQCYHLQ